jgi:hypothetical protein
MSEHERPDMIKLKTEMDRKISSDDEIGQISGNTQTKMVNTD